MNCRIQLGEVHIDAVSRSYRRVVEGWAGSQWWQQASKLTAGIAFKELFAVVMAAAVWGAQWRGSAFRQSGSYRIWFRSRTRQLRWIEAKHQFTMSIVHIAGVDNDPDDLSRNQLG